MSQSIFMLFEFSLYSSLLLVFFFHIIVYSVLFFARSARQSSYADRLMGWLLVVAALLITPYMVGFAGWYDNQPYRDILFFVPFVHALAIGPLMFFYTRAISNNDFKILGKQWLHFLPCVLYLVYTVGCSGLDVFYFKSYHFTNEYEDPDFANWYTWLSSVSILIYLFLSFNHYNQFKKFTALATSFAEQASLKWLRNFLYAFAILTVLPIIKEVLSNFIFFKNLRYFGPWYYYVAFSVVVYYIAINAYHAITLPLRRIHYSPQLLLAYEHDQEAITESASNKVLPPDEKTLSIQAALVTLMEEQQLFERPDLTLGDVAQRLGTNTVVLSRVINQQFGVNFNDYVNQYRVQAVIERIKDAKYRNQTLLAIALDAGFNSKATFNRAFKKITSKSPKDFL